MAYAKDGKSLSQGLEELQDKVKNAGSETEAINAAAEVFGTKVVLEWPMQFVEVL